MVNWHLVFIIVRDNSAIKSLNNTKNGQISFLSNLL